MLLAVPLVHSGNVVSLEELALEGLLVQTRLAGAVRKDETFQQRIARQAVRAVQARAGDLADGVEPCDVRCAVEVCADAAALVMRRRDDRDRLPGNVDAVAEAGLVDVGESAGARTRRAGG